MRAAVIINSGSGTVISRGLGRDEVVTLFKAAGIDADVEWLKGPQIAEAARSAVGRGVDMVVAGGGDGTISAVAGELAGTGIPLGVLPLGTVNNFARDLTIPAGLEDSILLIRGGTVRSIGLGQVNGHVFINNSSLGFYPLVVDLRERIRRRLHIGKWPAQIVAAIGVLGKFIMLRVEIGADGRTVSRTTPFVFIGNRNYEMKVFSTGSRSRIDDGRLFIYLLRSSGRLGLVASILKAAFSDIRRERSLESWAVKEATIDTTQPVVHVFADGEVVRLTPPLRYRAMPGALRVILP